MQAGLLDEVLPHGGGDGGHVADVLHHGGDGDGGHDQDGGKVKLGQDEGLDAHRAGGGHPGEIHLSGGQGHGVGRQHPQQDGDDLHHALAPDVGCHDDGDGQQGQPPVGGSVVDGAGGQGQADEDDDGAGDHRGQEAHDLVDAHCLNQPGQGQVEQAGHHNAAQGVGQLLLPGHPGVNAGVQLGHGGEAAQIGEGGAQEGGHLELCAEVEKQGAGPGEEEGGLDAQRQAVALDQDGHQNGGPEHGEHVLKAQDQHFGQAQLPGVADGLVVVHFCFSLLFSKRTCSQGA